MTIEPTPNLAGFQRRIADAMHAHWKLFLAQGILMMVLGLLAVALPNISTLAVEIFTGWLFFIGGIFRALAVFRARALPGYWWALLTSILAILLGLLLIMRPLEGVLTLTMILIAIFVFEGVGAIIIALEFRRHLRHWGWTLFSGVVDLVLAYLILQGWPSTAVWAIGLLVGVNMFFFGLSLVMTSIAARALKPL
jgi:uncharacterized membrane protein HdeD (DUF308 family)